MDKPEEKVCRVCGYPKTISFFPPSEWFNRKKPCCTSCKRDMNKEQSNSRGKVTYRKDAFA